MKCLHYANAHWLACYCTANTVQLESVMKISLLRDSEAFGSEKVKPIGGFLKATLFLIATRGRNLWLEKQSSLKKS